MQLQSLRLGIQKEENPFDNGGGGAPTDLNGNALVSPKANEFEIMSRIQNDFENRFQRQRPLSMAKVAKLLDELE